MQNSLEHLYQVSAIFIFCFALTILLFGNKELDQLIRETRKELENKNVLYEQESSNSIGDRVSYAELVGTLLGEVHYDIEIEGLLITASEFNPLQFNLSSIPVSDYRKLYEYDTNGNVSKVIYQLVQG